MRTPPSYRRGVPPWIVAASGTIALAALWVGCHTILQADRPPNVLLVTLDTVRADRIGAYGHRTASTPALDRLAREGVLFEDASTQAPLTAPAHVALLTGKYPGRFGIHDNAATPLPASATTLAEELLHAGYRTGAFVGAFVLDRPYGFAQGFEVFDADFGPVDSGQELHAERPGRAVVDAAIRWMSALSPAEPFFAWVHLYDAHAPYEPPRPFDRRFADRPYDGEVAAVDNEVGRLIAVLEAKGLFESTVIVAIGDHGEGLGDHGEDEHGLLLYDEVLRIPWILRLPTGPRGTRVGEQVRAIDLMPTLLDVIHVAARERLDGESVLDVVRGTPRRDVPPSYADSYYGRLHFGWSEIRSLRADGWKIIDAPRPALYDLRRDRHEKVDMSPTRSALASRMVDEARRIEAAFNREHAAPIPRPDSETLERLRSLGYVGATISMASGERGPDPRDMIGVLRQYRQLAARAIADIRGHRAAAAVPKLKQLIVLNERAHDLHIFLGDAYFQLGRFGEALDEYAVAAALTPTSAAPLVAAAHVFIAKGDPEAALVRAEEAECREPLSFEVPIVRGRALERLGRDADALAAYERAVGLNTANPRARANLANLALRLGRLEVANTQFRELLRLGYERARSRYGLGMVAERRGDRAAAAEEYRRALELDPNLSLAREALARLGAVRSKPRQKP